MPYIDFSFGNIDNKLHAMIKNGLFAILEKRFCFKYDCKCEQKTNCIVIKKCSLYYYKRSEIESIKNSICFQIVINQLKMRNSSLLKWVPASVNKNNKLAGNKDKEDKGKKH